MPQQRMMQQFYRLEVVLHFPLKLNFDKANVLIIKGKAVLIKIKNLFSDYNSNNLEVLLNPVIYQEQLNFKTL